MQCCNAGTASAKGITFGPNASGKNYDSLYTHRGTRRKSKWAVAPTEECRAFCTADAANWYDAAKNCYWSIANGGRIIFGVFQERLAKFPATQNQDDSWHGYPVFADVSAPQDCPSQVFVEAWIDQGVVTKTTAKRLLGYRL